MDSNSIKNDSSDGRTPFQGIIGSIPIGICRLSGDYRWLEANSKMAAIMGYGSFQELAAQGRQFDRYFAHDKDREIFKRTLQDREFISGFETRLHKRDGRIIWVSLSVQAQRDKKGRILFYEAYLEDITQQKHWMNISFILAGISHAVSTTRNLNHLYKAIHAILKEIVDTPNFFIAIVDKIDDRLLFPYYEDEFDQMLDIRNISDPETKSLSLEVIRSGKPLFMNKEQIKEKGLVVVGPKPEVWIGIPLMVKGSVIGAMAIQHYTNPHHFTVDDVNVMTSVSEQVALAIERKMNEDALRESEAKYRDILESIEDGYFEVDFAGDLTFFNDALCRILGYPRQDLLGMNNRQFMDEETAKKIYRAFKEVFQSGLLTKALDCKLIKKDGSECFVEAVVSLIQDANNQGIGFRGIARDVTQRKRSEEERKKLEAQLAQTRKMEGIGTLAGGIAHDFNNILGIILGNTELALNDMPEWNPARDNLEEVRNACLRARDVVKQILAFSRQTHVDRKPLKISSIIKESLKLLRSSLPATIAIELDIEEDAGTILADATQINQVMINLSANAAHAMADTGGILKIGLKKNELDEAALVPYQDLAPGRYAKLMVSDTGAGMAPEVVERIFDPYFTTKGVGEGTGMGLSVVHGIVKEHDGMLTVESEPGKGTTFSILFPIIEMVVAPETKTAAAFPTGTERVLFVDDEESLGVIAQKIIERLGYHVQVKTKPLDALAAFRSAPQDFDLVITDMTMPEMTGDRLVKELRQIRADIPIIITTGFSEKMDEEKAVQMEINAFILKPLRIGELANTMRRVLDDDSK